MDAQRAPKDPVKQELNELVDSIKTWINPARTHDQIMTIFRTKSRDVSKPPQEVINVEAVEEDDEGELPELEDSSEKNEEETVAADEAEEAEEGEEEDEEEGDGEEEEEGEDILDSEEEEELEHPENHKSSASNGVKKKRKLDTGELSLANPFFIDDEAEVGDGSDEEEKESAKRKHYRLQKDERLFATFKHYFNNTVLSALVLDWAKEIEERVKQNVQSARDYMESVREMHAVRGHVIQALSNFIQTTKKNEPIRRLYNLLCSDLGYKKFDLVEMMQMKGTMGQCAIEDRMEKKGSCWSITFVQSGGKKNAIIVGKKYNEFICSWVTLAKQNEIIKSEVCEVFASYLKDRRSMNDGMLFQKVREYATTERVEAEFFKLRAALVCMSQFLKARAGIVTLTQIAEKVDKNWFATEEIGKKQAASGKKRPLQKSQKGSIQLIKI